MIDKLRLKRLVYEAIKSEIESKISTLQSEYRIYLESAANETKSTAGDKHDTSKSMMQLEQEKLSTQLAQLQDQRKKIELIQINRKFETVEYGSLVETNLGYFFISISVRPITIEATIIRSISIGSPIGQVIKGLRVGTAFTFMGNRYTIQSIN